MRGHSGSHLPPSSPIASLFLLYRPPFPRGYIPSSKEVGNASLTFFFFTLWQEDPPPPPPPPIHPILPPLRPLVIRNEPMDNDSGFPFFLVTWKITRQCKNRRSLRGSSVSFTARFLRSCRPLFQPILLKRFSPPLGTAFGH